MTAPVRSPSIHPRRAAAVIAGKLSGVASRALGKGGGTALPGLVATRLDPGVVPALASQLSAGSVVVSGTNGKTTTARMLATILSQAGFDLLRNESGSNLVRGLAASLVDKAGFKGNLIPHARRLGIFEVDEATLPEVLATLTPRAVLLLDLFRDQLDRYGEVATVARVWSEALIRLSYDTTIVANADDPLVAEVATSGAPTVLFFGIESAERRAEAPEHASDVKACPRCGGKIQYETLYLGHLGHYTCSRCAFHRPRPVVSATEVRLDGVSGSTFRLTHGEEDSQVSLRLPGLYNVYNAVGAAAMGKVLGLDLAGIASALEKVTPAFGRMERLEVDGRQVYIALAKNPAGLNEVLRTILGAEQQLYLLMMLNDNVADGLDVSWIWDADIEMLQGRVSSVVFAGTRAEDMALRFKYAGALPTNGGGADLLVMHDTRRAFLQILHQTGAGRQLFIVPTYTALLDIRNTLAQMGYVKPYWEQ